MLKNGIPRDAGFVRYFRNMLWPAPSALVNDFRKYYGPTMNAFDAAEKNGRAAALQRNWKTFSPAKTKPE